MNLRESRRLGEERLAKAGVADAAADARLLQEWVTGISMTEYARNPSRALTRGQEAAYLELIEKRSRRIPLQHLTGEQEFMGLTFRVNSDVLIPRQETELLAEEALKRLRPGMRVLDLCTGSGCIIISLERLGKERGKADGTNLFVGSDISHAALWTAKENACLLGASARFVQSSIFDAIQGPFDLIVSNPPYIPTGELGKLEEEVRCHDPILALDGKEDGLYFYRKIVREAGAFLRDGAELLFEIGYNQAEAVSGLMKENGFAQIRVQKDLAGLDRIVTGRYDG